MEEEKEKKIGESNEMRDKRDSNNEDLLSDALRFEELKITFINETI